ncbi:MAG: acetolactate synthase large subunit [gamma proteobacterium symbiont of Bathyaustriella thionipta]|nr:acetolactate synthase large subunit [gamma proteobacterium symbiont of Bathyaustriella thionipta]MCU7950509.1 acetolactate synthase large subunit [gamma proteobacterium symbiont of Bathyaustriella thionipta]MCU7953242.1 acetolactate synthase large subunit [gamma proteobacterium symbiont of Bathyaustriella thionipta]MCU7957003.1 acetolactate synthase large subunit [gamma proteobacterium symbiont of Bathyaustriella thionipta]MCU7965937.1 acetolactate synthase large subunit [gamma proteobacteri
MKASDLLVKALENEQVEYIFGIPGEENLDFLDSLKTSSIKLILTRHEQGAGFMAATYGRLTGKPGVCLSTLGPGATNFVTAAAYAQLGGMPMMMISGQKPIKKSKQGLFQIVDIVHMMKPLTKYTRQIVNANNIPSSIREAFRLAMEERPGAVHIELPEDVAAEDADERLFDVVNYQRPDADDMAIASAVKMIEHAKMPLLLIGAGANRKSTQKALSDFIETTGMRFFSTQMGKGVVDERHPQFLGTAALSDHDFLHCAINRADLIVNVGHDIMEKPPFLMEEGGKQVIHVNFFPNQVDDVYFPQLNVVGDISTSVKKITQRIEDNSNWDLTYFNKIKQEVDTHLSKYSTDNRFPVLPQRVVNIVRNQMPEDGIVTLDNGVYKIWFARNYPCYQPNTLLLDNALATMGAGLPSAIAAKLINPNKKVIAVCGDGGFMMNSQEMETAVRLKLNLIVIILNDNAFGMIKWKQEGSGFDNFGLDYNNPDFVKYAESYGALGYQPGSCSEFNDTLERCLQTDGVHLIDLAVDYSLNHSILNEKLKQKTCIL